MPSTPSVVMPVPPVTSIDITSVVGTTAEHKVAQVLVISSWISSALNDPYPNLSLSA